jgi:hypothetical protein
MATKFRIIWYEKRYITTVLTADNPRQAMKRWEEPDEEFWENMEELEYFPVKGSIVLEELEDEEVKS